MKSIAYVATLSVMLCVVSQVMAAPQAVPPPERPVAAEQLPVPGGPADQVMARLQARRAAEQSEAAAAEAQAIQGALTDYQRTFSLVNDAGIAPRPDHAQIIRYTETDPKALASMDEDMSIMGRILEKAVRQSIEENQREAMGIRLVTVPSPGGARNFQIEGFGAVFQLGVNFPLVGPVDKTDETVSKEPTNSAWDETKRELYGPRGRGGRRGGPPGTPSAVYDPKRVDNLKNSILEALKNAANMQSLKSDESVTVVVTSASMVMTGGGWAASPDSNQARQWSAANGSPGGSSTAAGSSRVAGFGGSGGTRGGGFGGGGGTTVTATESESSAVYDERTGSTIVRSGSGTNAMLKVVAGQKAPNSGTWSLLAARAGRPETESVLTIRARKSDIDAFAKGKLGLDDFRKKVSMQIY